MTLLQIDFHEFYQQLYRREERASPGEMESFLNDLNIPHFLKEESRRLDSPITLEKVRQAVYEIPTNKSPRVDVLPIEINCIYTRACYYQNFTRF